MIFGFSKAKQILGFFIPLSLVIFSALLLRYPSLFGLSSDRVTTALIALIGVEFLIERLSYFEKLPRIAEVVEQIGSQQKCFGYRGDFGSMDEMIKSAKSEIIISGLNLNALHNVIQLLEDRARNRVKIKLLALHVDAHLIEEVAFYFGDETESFRKRLEANLAGFYGRLQAQYPKMVEIKTLSFRPAFGYAAIDSSSQNGYIRVESYTCSSGQISRPMMQFTKRSMPREFAVYLEDLMKLWGKGRIYSTLATSGLGRAPVPPL